MFNRESRSLYKNYMSDRSNENKRNVKKVEKALKYELRRCEVEAMDNITMELEDTASRIIVKYCTDMLVNWEGAVNLDLTQLNIGTGNN